MFPTRTPRWPIGAPWKVLMITRRWRSRARRYGRACPPPARATTDRASPRRPAAVGPLRDLPRLVRRETGEDGVLELGSAVDGGDHGVAGTGQRRADSVISRSTVSTLRLALMRRMAAERAAIRSRSASTSRPGSLLLLNGSSSRFRYGIPAGSAFRCPRRRAGGRAWARFPPWLGSQWRLSKSYNNWGGRYDILMHEALHYRG